MGVAVMGADAGDGGEGVLDAVLGRLARAVDALSVVPFTDLPMAEQARAVEAIVALRSRLEAVEAAAVRAFDAGGEWGLDGHRSAAAALSHRCRLSRAEARRRVRLARRLADAPEVAAALAAGEITGEQADLLVTARRPGVEAEFDRDVDVLVHDARTLSHADLRVVLRYWSDQVDPVGAQRRADRIEQSSRAFVSRTLDDQVRVDAWLDPVGGTAFLAAVERIEDEFFHADWAEAEAVHGSDTTVGHLARTPTQRRADALVELAVRATAAPADAKRPLPLVNVVMDAATFERALRQHVGLATAAPPAGTPVQCELLDGTVLTPSQAIEQALAGHVRRVVYETVDLLAQNSPKRRLLEGAARDGLVVLDRRCTHPGCDQPAWRCEADHLEPWNGSNTTQTNGRLLCRYHHRLRQRLEHPPHATRGPDGALIHVRADGTPIAGPPPRRRHPG